MGASLRASGSAGLERSCTDWLHSSGPVDGVELLQARFGGRGFAPHRHDTYGIAVTDLGVQTFDYRGAVEHSLPGQVTVLHPDEMHDGRAGTDAGFGYRIVYVAPALIGEALRAIAGRAVALPFVRQPVTVSPELAAVVAEAFEADLTEALARDSLVARLTEGLVHGEGAAKAARPKVDPRGVELARAYLDALDGPAKSVDLEALTGLTRYELARQFRIAYGTSPYRYSVLRRLDRARQELRRGQPTSEVALDTGFADQAHFTRHFVAAFGVPPARYAALHVRAVRTSAASPGPRPDTTLLHP
jgi:AraC-like DNA-binding protein